jgi:hypothetical protein
MIRLSQGFTSQRSGLCSPLRLLMPIAVVALFASQVGCASMWNQVRESERMMALETARTQTGRGQCHAALSSLDRSQARTDIGPYSRESTIARARCYDKIGQTQLAAAHRRLINDFYTDEPMAYPEPDGNSVFRAKNIKPSPLTARPYWLKLNAPRYTEYAKRSKIVGRVIVVFELAGNDRPRKIRVLEMPHPLLATWAIEAVAAAEPKRKKDSPDLVPGTQYIATFLFQYRWAGEEEEWDGDS